MFDAFFGVKTLFGTLFAPLLRNESGYGTRSFQLGEKAPKLGPIRAYTRERQEHKGMQLDVDVNLDFDTDIVPPRRTLFERAQLCLSIQYIN